MLSEFQLNADLDEIAMKFGSDLRRKTFQKRLFCRSFVKSTLIFSGFELGLFSTSPQLNDAGVKQERKSCDA